MKQKRHGWLAVALGALALLTTANGLTGAEAEPPKEPEDMKMYAGSKVYIHPMDGFENYFAAAMMNKKVALGQTTKPEDADYHINIAAEEQKAGWAKILLRGSTNSAVDMSVILTNPKTGSVLWTCSVSKGNAIRGKRSAAEACAKRINKFLHAKQQ